MNTSQPHLATTGGAPLAAAAPAARAAAAATTAPAAAVAITIDYEIYDFLGGNRVDLNRDMLAPTEQLMQTAERHGARLTLMFEMGAYLLFDQSAGRLARHIERQLQDAVARGHDVQLHLHPHLLPQAGARYDAARSRVWFRDYRRVHELLARDPGLFRRCRERCEALLKPIDPDYEMIVFRAGKYQVQPHAAVYAALAEAGFLAASNVVQGRYLRRYGRTLGYDYRTAWTGCRPYFPAPHNINWPARGGVSPLLELPICVHQATPWSLDALDGPALARVFQACRSPAYPLIMLGHSKGTTPRKLRAFDEGLDRIRAAGAVEFTRLADVARRWLPREQQRRATAWQDAVQQHCLSAVELKQRLSRGERETIDALARQLAQQAGGGGTYRAGVFGCGTGYALLLPLADRLREWQGVRLLGDDSDPLALALAASVAGSWGLDNVAFGAAAAGSLDLAVVCDLYACHETFSRDLQAAGRGLAPTGRLIQLRRRPGRWARAKSRLNDLRLALSFRLPQAAKVVNQVRRGIKRHALARSAGPPSPPLLRTLRAGEPR